MLPSELINRILKYNIHPVAELIKKIINLAEMEYPKAYDFYEYALYESIFLKEYCYDCHKPNPEIHLSFKNFCEDCYQYIDPNDDIVTYTSFEILEFRTCLYAVLNRINN